MKVLYMALLALACGALATGAPPSHAAGDEKPAGSGDVVVATAQPAAPAPPVFIPPNRGAPKTRVGGATRGTRTPGAPSLAALVPEDGGLTLEPQPVLYWYLSQPTNGRVDVTIVDESSVAPLLEATIQGPIGAGVHAIRLADHGVSLAPGVDYQWFVALVPDAERRSNDVIAGGGIERIESPAGLREKLESSPEVSRSNVLAAAGIWYDALDVLSRAVEAAPRDTGKRSSRAALFEQVGLTEVARVEREAAGAGSR
jgi:hypothetical protein